MKCNCICHKVNGVMHVMACCHVCPHCHEKIALRDENGNHDFDAFDKHVKVCLASKAKQEPESIPPIPTVGEELERIINGKRTKDS